MHKKWTHSVNFLKADDWGKMISIEINIENTKLNLMSIYAPNNCTQREIFFTSILHLITPHTIIGGDFNTSFSQKDRYNTMHCFDRAYYKLQDLLSTNDLIDLWRSRNANSNTYSWKRIINGTLKMSRIDFYLIPSCFKSYVKNIF